MKYFRIQALYSNVFSMVLTKLSTQVKVYGDENQTVPANLVQTLQRTVHTLLLQVQCIMRQKSKTYKRICGQRKKSFTDQTVRHHHEGKA